MSSFANMGAVTSDDCSLFHHSSPM